MYQLSQLAQAFDVPDDTLFGWAQFGRMGRKEGRSRYYSSQEAFALGLLAGVRAAGQSVSPTLIDAAQFIANSLDRPSHWTIAETDACVFLMDIAAATKIINEQLGVIR